MESHKTNIQRTARFEALAARAARSLEGRSKSESLVNLWLESLLLDLLQQRKEGANVKHLLFALQPGDTGMIQLVCHESATFCARLETKAHNDEARSGTLTPDFAASSDHRESERPPRSRFNVTTQIKRQTQKTHAQ